MARTIWTSVLTLGVVLTVNGIAAAGDDGTTKSGIGGGFAMTLGGTGTAAQAAANADDAELTFHHRRYYGGGYYGGYGYSYPSYSYGYSNFYCPPYYGGGFGYGGYGGGFAYSRPYYGGGFGYGGGYSYGGYYGGYRGHYGHHRGYWRINGTDEDAPVISLAMTVANNPMAAKPAPAAQPNSGTWYDGGPANPVPLPKAESGTRTAPATGLPVSLPKTQPTKYTFKAYGEK